MTTQQWHRRPVPSLPGGGHALGEWELRSPIDLTVSRGQLRAPVQVRVVGTAEGWLIDVSDAAAS